MKTLAKVTKYVAILFVLNLLVGAASVHAYSFVKDTDPGGEKFYIIDANKDVSLFSGSVGSNDPDKGTIIDVSTTGTVDTGSGYANIKPIKEGLLTALTFTPADDTKYGDFSFRAQLVQDGFIYVKVLDAFDVVWDFEYGEFKANADIGRIGVVSNDGDWLKSVMIFTTEDESFKEVKQIDFSYLKETPPVPEPGTVMLLGVGMLGLAVFGKRRMNKEA
ncbi:PEP-CTERM sorting domain-containing protein [Geomonas azotofigens]|uniref:PEP-CTERM sorting domain-containing protein n=1 Tax=Geomonas azotofigens TaxID=2843196 RepID=UPI001F2B1847|nr:PEP-CTERM sorting domain-containing protein [Geomonas azotofigens]